MKVRLLDISIYEGCDFFSKVGDIVEARDCDGIGYTCLCKTVGTELGLFFPYHKVEVIEEKTNNMKVRYIKKGHNCTNTYFTIGNDYEVISIDSAGDYKVYNDRGEPGFLYKSEALTIVDDETKDEHYNNENGSLYLFAQQHELNAWEFDIIKRIVRCRKKGQFKEDLEKTKRVIDLYLKEFES